MAKKKAKEPKTEYVVRMNERQLRLIMRAMEEYGRLRMGQTWDLSDDLAFQHYDRTAERENGEYKEFDRRILRRDACRELLDLAMRAACGGDYLNHWQKTEDVEVALDMYCTVRKFFWEQRPESEKDTWTVASGPLYLMGPDPKMEIEKVTVDG